MPHRLEIPILCLVNLFAVVQGQLGRSCDNPSVCTVPVRSCFHRPLPSNAPLGEVNYACNCSENELIGYACNVRSPLGHIDFQTCYGNDCRTGCFTSDGYPGLYRDRWTAIYLLFIPGATRIDFEFTGEGGFDIESFKDDLFIGPGLEFNDDDLRLSGVILPGSLVRFYDNRNLSGEVYPPPFSMATDSVWIFFQTDKNIQGNGWKLSWRSTVDTTPPTVIGCPSDITEILSLGMGSSLSVTWDPEPFGNDASPPVTTIASHSPGQFFVIGTTTVTYTFQDRFENNAICSFDVNVVEVDNTPPECVNLPADISETVELGTPNTQVFYIEPTCSDISGTASVIARTHTPPATFNVGVTTVSYTCGDASGNTETCSFSVSVTAVDTTPPTLMCAQDVQETIELGRTGTAVFWTEPTATDISGTVSLQSRSHSPGSTFPVGESTVTYVFIDNAGNSATCTFRVVVLPVDSTPPMCENLPANVVEMVELGTTGTVISWTEPTCSDVSGTAVVTARSNTPFSFFEVGTTTVTYTCTDAAGNSESCSFPVTVVAVDTTSPTCVNLPTGVFETVELGQPGTVVTWTEPTCSDTSGVATVTMRSQVPSSFFPVGMTMVTYTCTDGSGNNEMCSFTVTVTEVDRTAPMCVNIPTGVSDTVELGTLGRQVTWVELTCSDLSGTAQVTSRSHTPNSFFTVGSTEVTYICTDASGNSESCIFSVTVIAVDTTAPECVNLPIDIGRTVELGTPGIEISWIEPSCSDLSGTASISTRSHTPPSFFAVGMAVVSYTCTDMSGNSNTCSFSVTVSTDDKEELLSLRNEMEKGLESLPKPQEMGRGHRVKRKSKGLNYSSDETVETEPAKPKKKKKQHAARSKESSHFQRLMTEVLQNEIKKKQQPLLQDHAEAIQELRDEISQLKTEKKQLEMENRNLRKTIQLMKDLPELLSEVKKTTKDLNACRQASSKLSKIEESAEVEGPEDSDSVATNKPPKSELHKLSLLVARCNTHEASKFVNDMLTGLYSNEYLSRHSLTGYSSIKDEGDTTKQKLDPAVVNEIIENDESENDDLDLDRAEDAAEAHVPRMGVNPYMFEPVLAEEAHPREEPAAANPANQDRLRVLDWCQCDNCTLMQTVEESICCREYQQIVDTMEETDTPDACLTRHEAYNRIVLCPFVLKVAYIGYSTRERRQMPQDQNGRYRYTAYRQVVRWIWEILGRNNRIPLPSCVVNTIVQEYPPQPGRERRGFRFALLD